MLHTLQFLVDDKEPTEELTAAVKDLYSRSGDVRFMAVLFPVLTQHEIVALIPSIIRQSSANLKYVTERLMSMMRGRRVEEEGLSIERADGPGIGSETAINPVEYLVQLHIVDTDKADVNLKQIKAAIQLCYAQPHRDVYTPEVLAIVMQTLVDRRPTPLLLMYTVLTSIQTWPELQSRVCAAARHTLALVGPVNDSGIQLPGLVF